jgi:tRNA(Met) cytidine acetyltransferase
MNSATILPSNVSAYLETLNNNRHRQLLLLTGSQDWTSFQANTLIEQLQGRRSILSRNKDLLDANWPEHNHQILGQEYRVGLYDGYQGISPDKLAALAGTITAGGVLILIQPELKQLDTFIDPEFQTFQSAEIKSNLVSYFNQRLGKQLDNRSCIKLDEKNGWQLPEIKTNPVNQLDFSQQQTCIEAITKTCLGRANRPLLITADRGRGKSSALGLAAAELIKDNKKVIISATQRRSVESAFKHLALATKQKYKTGDNSLANLSFVAPDKLINEAHKADVIFIDEAAALPVPILKKILELYPRVVFATTIYGYEGTGRGFTLRFIPYLNDHYKNWQNTFLNSPIRFALNDPLENTINQLLCLQADCSVDLPEQFENIQIKESSQAELSQNETLLNQVFGLLVLAHYQTTVNDLRQMLDGNKVKVFISLKEDIIVAAALVAIEGQLSQQLSDEILNGTRRPKGHLLAQSIAQLDNSDYFLKNKVARIIRIAVHPKLTRNKFGSQLLQHIESSLSTQVKAIGASFGGYASLLSFWQNLNYRTIKVGFKKDKVSGEHACLVLKSLDSTSQIPVHELKQQLSYQLPLYLIHSFNTLNATLVVELLKYLLPSKTASLENDLADIKRYLRNQHSLEQVIPNLWRVIWGNIPILVKCTEFTQELIIKLILQNQDSTFIQKSMSIKGKKQLSIDIKASISEFINQLK